jgi:hypothetical protein
MLPLYGATFLAKRLRNLAKLLTQSAEVIEARRSLSRHQHSILQRNAAFADKHKGQPAFVIVNGPSLITQNILPLKNQVTFVVSGFWKHEAVLSWQPTYYSLLDANFFNDTQATRDFYQNMLQRIHSSTFFVPLFRGFDAIRRYQLLPDNRTYYVASVGEKASNNDLTKIVQGFAGVSAFALSQAIYMGCNPIYLLGFDHDYLANRGVDRHFYTGGTISGHPSTNIPLSQRISYDDEMRANLRLWENYRILDVEAKRKGIQIINSTDGGYLDVFPRARFESLKF